MRALDPTITGPGMNMQRETSMSHRRAPETTPQPLFAAVLFAAVAPLVAGCASVAEGVTKALVESNPEPDELQCEITGPAFDGIEAIMREQKASQESVKVMLVHGMGSPEPGYSARFQHNLTRDLGLTVRSLRPKEIGLRSPEFDDVPLGKLTVWRYTDEADARELIFYEVTWSEIVELEKKRLAYDTSGQYRYKRAALNQVVKRFLNERMSDPVIYAGKPHHKILESVAQGHCWMFYLGWNELPSGEARACHWLDHGIGEDLAQQQFVFVTHSMGSRVLIDTLHHDVKHVEAFLKSAPTELHTNRGRGILREFQRKKFHVFMMANQLPLMQLGRDAPEVVGKSPAYCTSDGPRFNERILSQLSVVAFSDPNDVLSYAIPPTYAHDYMDARLCPSVTNVILNITPVHTVFRIGDVADPFEAHDGYDDDERVLGLMIGGLGREHVAPAVSSGCRWLRTVDD